MSKARLTAIILAAATLLGAPAGIAAASPAVTATGTGHHAVVADTWTRHTAARDTWT